MVATSTSADHAVHLSKTKGGILNTYKAFKPGIHPRTLYALRDNTALEQVGGDL
jgi:hypothetical protein